MVSKLELEGWWDQVCMREGWSHKISKWKWVFLHSIIPLLILLPLGLFIVSFFEGFSPREFFTTIFIMMPLVALFQSGGWNRDQRKSEEV